MKRIISTITALLLVLLLSVNAFAIKIDFSFKATPDELTSDEYFYSFGRTETSENLKEIGFKVNGEKYVLSEPSLYTANKTGVFGVGFRDANNLLGDSFGITPYYVTEENEEVEGEIFTINKGDYIDNDAGIKLSSILVDGNELSYFNENVHSYDFGISYEDMEVNNPEVTATAKNASSVITYNKFSTGVEITVSEEGRYATYTVNFKPETSEKITQAAVSMGTKRRDDVNELVPFAANSGTYTTAIRNNSINQDADATNPNRFGNISYMTFDIPENINYEDEIIFEIRARALNTVPQDLKIYAYEYNEDAMPYFKNDSYTDYGYLGKVLNPEGWPVYNEVNQTWKSCSCDISSYIAKLVALGKTKATVAVYFDSDKITEYWKAYHAGTYTYPTDLSINLVTNTDVIKNTTAVAYKDGYPKITYTEFAEYEPKNLALLSSIAVDGEAISYFDESIFTYNIAVEDSENLPTVTVTPKSDEITTTISELGNGVNINVLHKNGTTSTYVVNFCTGKATNEYPVFQGSKQIRYDDFTEISTEGTAIVQLEVRSYTNASSALSNQVALLSFDTSSDVIDYEKGVKLSIVVKQDYTKYPADYKIVAYEYDKENTFKREGENDKSNMGAVIDSLTLSEGTVVNNNESYRRFEFDITNYVLKMKESGENTIKVVIGHDKAQYDALKAAYADGTFTQTYVATFPYAYNKKIIEYRGQNSVFNGAEPTLSYDELTKIAKPDHAIITAIKLGDNELNGFDPEIFTYNIGIEDIENIPEVTAVAKFEGTTVTVSGEGTQKIITVINGDYTKVYTINFALLESVSKSTVYQAYKQIQNNEDKYVEIKLDESTSTTLSVRGYADKTNCASSTQTLMKFDLADDVVDVSKGVYLKVRVKGNYSKYPQDIRLCAYEYDPENSIKRNGTGDNSYMGELIDSIEISKGTVHPASASYYDFVFDISSYIAKIQASEESNFKIILGLDYEQITEYQAIYQKGEYSYEYTDLAFSIYPNDAYISNYTGAGNVFDGAAPVLTYKRLKK